MRIGRTTTESSRCPIREPGTNRPVGNAANRFPPHPVKITAALLAVLATALSPALLQAAQPERLADGLVVAQGDGWLKLTVCADDIIRVAYARDREFFDRPSLIVEHRAVAPAAWSLDGGPDRKSTRTQKIQVRVDLASGAVTFFDAAGQTILAER